LEPVFTRLKADLEKSLVTLKDEMGKVRTGRASINMLDDVRVDYYGSPTPLNQVATIHVPEARLITVQPWESKIIPEIEKGIQKLGMSLNPINDGKIIRIPIPSLTEERRKEMVKLLKKYAEEARVGIRMHRRDANEAFKALQKDGKITEDDLHRSQDQVQKQTDETIKKVDELVEHKEKDILTM